MSLSHNVREQLLELAKKAALAAGEIIASYDGKLVKTNLKEGGKSLASQVVTEVDHKAEKAILEVLRPTLKEYDLGLLTEETPDDGSRFEKDFFWCIDPLDGTLPFSEGRPGYGTSIALVSREGRAVMGVVYDPLEKNLYWAMKNSGAFKTDSPLKNLKSSGEVRVISESGGAVMQAMDALESAPCVFYKKPKKELGGGCLWDFAATSIICEEAGGFCSDYSFKPLNLNNSETIFINHCGVIYAFGLEESQIKEFLA